MKDWIDRLKALYRRADDMTGGRLKILGSAVQSFNDARASQAAAGMAYYTLFSLFPLLLAVIAAGSFVLESEQVYQQAVQVVTEALPTSQGLIERNIDRVLNLRGPVGLVGLVSLLWSGTGAFATLAYNVNLAWPQAQARNLLEKRLVALVMVGILILLLLISLFSTTFLGLLSQLQVPLWGGVDIYDTFLWTLISKLLPWPFTFLLFVGLYRGVPNIKVKWRAAFWGAVVAALGWEITASLFTWYLGSGLARYELVYGSLGTVVALMFWIYVSSLIILFGAHLSAAVGRKGKPDPKKSHTSNIR